MSVASDVTCRRCGETRTGLDRPPLPGDVGQELLSGTCRPCWDDWMVEQTKLINERALTPVNPDHYGLIVEELRRFLKLEETEG